MSKLAAAEVEAGINSAVDNNSAAYSRSESNNNNVLVALSCSVYNLAEGSSISVVFNENFCSKLFA